MIVQLRVAGALVVGCCVSAAGCSARTEGKPPPPTHECATTFAGTWKIVDEREQSGGAACAGVWGTVETTATVNDALSVWQERALEGGPRDYETSGLNRNCETIELARVDVNATSAQTTKRTLRARDGALLGQTVVRVYEVNAYAASGADAVAMCTATYKTTGTR